MRQAVMVLLALGYVCLSWQPAATNLAIATTNKTAIQTPAEIFTSIANTQEMCRIQTIGCLITTTPKGKCHDRRHPHDDSHRRPSPALG